MSEVSERSDAAKLRRMRRIMPWEWAKRVRAAMRQARGRIPDAAAALGVHEHTLYRWLDTPDPLSGELLLYDVPRVAVGVRRSIAKRSRG